VRAVGRMTVDFAGTYLMHRQRFHDADLPDDQAAPSFVYSFQLLQRLAELGCRFERRPIRTFRRQQGASREVSPGRIWRVFREVWRHRL
jgi:hypothetical protein